MLHPEQTKVVYCKDTNRKGEFAILQFDFLGYAFRPRLAKWQGGLYGVSYLPAASPTALKPIRECPLQTQSYKSLHDLARTFNPYIRGWIDHYSHFYKSALYSTLCRIDALLLRRHDASSNACGSGQRPLGADLFAYWPLCIREAEHWEPYESRCSPKVLGSARGEIPPRDSLALEPPSRALRPRCLVPAEGAPRRSCR
ncbi:group II intron maturase-specific domain-containing protein [Bradyrhizobium sp. UFLA01-814]|uniref:group II intron maturase-specific domain-containing protein n=1 Tax=Bradyrhizobium sp. UFLA01-814 TaxID=3023480 RepID=UPI00398B9B60